MDKLFYKTITKAWLMLKKWLDMDLKQDQSWEEIMADANAAYESFKTDDEILNDCISKIILCSVDVIEKLYKGRRL